MKIGLYGGTFSPPHLGHIRAARCFVDGMGLDKLVIMPAGIPPHKAVIDPVPNENRLEMARIAFSNIGEVNDYEMSKDGASFTYLTLRWLKAQYDGDIYLCMGEDMFLCLDKWREAEEIFNSCVILCLKREKSSYSEIEKKKTEFEMEYNARISILSYEPLPVSSTEIRNKIRNGDNLKDCLSEEVATYILKNNLYI